MMAFQGPEATTDASHAAFWLPHVALVLGASKNKANDGAAQGAAKQLARLGGAARLLREQGAQSGIEATDDFTQALQACSES